LSDNDSDSVVPTSIEDNNDVDSTVEDSSEANPLQMPSLESIEAVPPSVGLVSDANAVQMPSVESVVAAPVYVEDVSDASLSQMPSSELFVAVEANDSDEAVEDSQQGKRHQMRVSWELMADGAVFETDVACCTKMCWFCDLPPELLFMF